MFNKRKKKLTNKEVLFLTEKLSKELSKKVNNFCKGNKLSKEEGMMIAVNSLLFLTNELSNDLNAEEQEKIKINKPNYFG